MNQRIYNYSTHLIAAQDYSEFKLRKKLLSKKNNLPHEVDEVILALKAKKLIQEDRYRQLFIKKWLTRGETYEKIKMRAQMEKLTISKEDFKETEKEEGVSTQDNLEKLIIKKIRSKQIPEDRAERKKLQDKILRFLLSKGHHFDDAKKSLNRIILQQEDQ